jgi:hypothetical protein
LEEKATLSYTVNIQRTGSEEILTNDSKWPLMSLYYIYVILGAFLSKRRVVFPSKMSQNSVMCLYA